MMAAAHFDPREDGRFPSDDARAALQAALGGFVRNGGRPADEEATAVATLLKQVSPDQLVTVWNLVTREGRVIEV